MEKIFIKCYVAGKKAGIICDGSQEPKYNHSALDITVKSIIW